MKKIISVIAAVLLAGQVGYIHTLYAASSQDTSKSKQSTSKKTNKNKSAKNKSDKGSSKQIENAKSSKKTTSVKHDTTKSSKKTLSTKSSSSIDKSKQSTQNVEAKSTITPVAANTAQPENPVTEGKTSDVAINPTPVVAAVNHPPVDCLYQLSSTAPISEKELAEWAQLAVVKSFDYSFETLETQLQKLKGCYTEQGWLGFNDALKQSGNLATIKAQQLTVSSEIEGKLKVNAFKNNQWKITVPLKVVYQNTQEKLTQRLFVEMVVAKKSSTQLGIVQIIAEPKAQKASKEASTS